MKSEAEKLGVGGGRRGRKGGTEEQGERGTFAAPVQSHRPPFSVFFFLFFFLLSSAWDARICLLISGSSQVASFRWTPQLNGAPL